MLKRKNLKPVAGWTSALSAEGRDSPAQGFPKHSHCTLLHWHCKLQIAHCTLHIDIAHFTLHIASSLKDCYSNIVIGTYCYWHCYWYILLLKPLLPCRGCPHQLKHYSLSWKVCKCSWCPDWPTWATCQVGLLDCPDVWIGQFACQMAVNCPGNARIEQCSWLPRG